MVDPLIDAKCKANMIADHLIAHGVTVRERGRWVIEDADTGELGVYSAFLVVKCSECDYDYSVESGQYGWYLGDPFPYNFCPNCGAKMDGGNKDV